MWDTFSKILNVALGLMAIYLYFENRGLKSFEIDKDIKIIELEIKELERKFPRKKEKLLTGLAARGLTFSGERAKDEDDLEKDHKNHIDKLKAELEHLQKLKKYRWIFSK